MKRRYINHSANERTFLAWIRTSISIIGIGIIVTKLTVSQGGKLASELLVYSLLISGAILMIMSFVRYQHMRTLLDKESDDVSPPIILDAVLVLLLLVQIMALCLAILPN